VNRKGNSSLIVLLIIVVVLGTGFYLLNKDNTSKEITDITDKLKVGSGVKLTNDYEGAKVDPGDISQGCLGGQDCIPSIDNPVYESVEEANSWLRDDDIVFGVLYNDEVKSYPQRIMNWHEIVNDKYGDDFVAVTFCPLCGTAISFRALVDGEESEFGVSGKLYNSDLIMYDRIEGNYWQQLTGEAIVGPAARRDEFLEMLSTTTATWGQWKEKHPDTVSLSRETGASRNYDLYPYGTYEENGEIYFGVENSDSRLHPKAIKYGILIDGKAKAYVLDSIPVGTLNDTFNGVDITITRDEANQVTFTNDETGEEIVAVRGFWFAWAAFYPETELFE